MWSGITDGDWERRKKHNGDQENWNPSGRIRQNPDGESDKERWENKDSFHQERRRQNDRRRPHPQTDSNQGLLRGEAPVCRNNLNIRH
jgi:hypothetical protein